MNYFTITLSLALCAHMAMCWDDGLRKFTLDTHNEIRRKVGACQMNKLEYDMELEHQAETWLANCRFEHESLAGRGENLAWNSHHNPEKDMIQEAFDAWYDEINIYTYGQRSCSQSCHYTQLVWSSVMKVGCTARRCANLVNGGKDSWFFGCFYTPQGNFNGEKPYEKTCDKPCLEGQTQEAGLCVGEPKGEDSVEEKCEDTSASCEIWAEKGQCKKNPAYMDKKCPVACGICEGESYKAPKDACHDDQSGCATWAKKGFCYARRKFMSNHCKKTCKLC